MQDTNQNINKDDVIEIEGRVIDDSDKPEVLKLETSRKESFFKRLKIKPYELAFLICDVLVVLSVFIFFEKNLLSFSCSFVGCFAIFSLAKGFFFAPILNIVFDVLYIILSYTQSYFGEAIIFLVMTLPIDVYSSISWRKNKAKESEVIKINKLGKKEWIVFWISTAIVSIVFYFVLKALNTNELIISTISFVTSAMAGYFLIRRSNYYSLAYSFNDIILIILWTISLINYGTSYLPIVINWCCCLVIDIYGFINLQKEQKKQMKENQSSDGVEVAYLSNGHIIDDYGVDYVEFANKDDIIIDAKIENKNLKNDNSENARIVNKKIK